MSSWLIVAGSLVAYLGLVTALGLAGLGPDVPLPWWAALAVPPLLYALLVRVVARPRSTVKLATGVALLWVAHLLVGALTLILPAMLQGADLAGLASMFPPPLLGLLWVPVLLVPLKDVLGGDTARPAVKTMPLANRRVPPERRTPTPPVAPPTAAPAPARPAFERPTSVPPRPTAATPVLSMEARLDATRRPTPAPPTTAQAATAAPAKPAVQDAPASAASGPPANEVVNAVAARADRWLEQLAAKDNSDEPVRVSFDRVRGQLPADAFTRPLEELAGELTVPGALLIPRRLVLAQLADGIVRADWDQVSGQIPDDLVATSHADITARLPQGQIVLPLDEVIGQFPAAVFMPDGPEADLRAIESFPAPFQPIDGLGPACESPALEDELGILRPDESAATPADEPVSPATVIAAQTRPSSPAAARDDHVSTPSSVAPEGRAAGEALDDAAAPQDASYHAGQPAADTSPVRELLATVSPLGLFALASGPVNGFDLIALASSAFDDDAIRSAARLLLPVLASHRGQWPVEQVTLRGPSAALVLTPFGPLSPGHPVVAALVPRGGALALLELRCRQAAARYAARRSVPIDAGVAAHDDRDEPNLLDVEPSTRVREIASSLAALGTVEASSLREADAGRALYLFVPRGSDVRAIGALANDLSQAMRQAPGVPFRSAMLRSGARRMVIQLPATSSHSDTIVAAGETARPGLAYRQVEHAAVALGAL